MSDDVGFELDEIARDEDRLVISGRWSGVRGRRFVRPSLLRGDESILALLDDKPWDPATVPWRAAFPWDGDAPDPSDLELSVGPDVVVRLADGRAAAETPRKEPARGPADGSPGDDGADRRARTTAERERDHALARLEEAERDRDAALRTRRRMETLAGEERGAREEAESALAREREAVRVAERSEKEMRARLAEANAARDDASRARRAAEGERDAAQEAAARAEREREEAASERDRLRGLLNEAVLARETAERRLRTLESAERQPAPQGRGTDEEAETRSSPEPSGGAEDDDGRPLGVRRIPAFRAGSDDLLRAPGASPAVTQYDVWAIRILGGIAALCVIGVLLSVLVSLL